MPSKPPPGAPYAPAKYEAADLAAIRAMARGEASDYQQTRALKWIIENVCGTYDLSYRPDSDRDSAFAEGKRYAGLQIVKAINLNPKIMRKDNDVSGPSSRQRPGRPGLSNA